MCTLSKTKLFAVVLAVLFGTAAQAAEQTKLPIVEGVELQPLAAQVERVIQALELAGAPLSAEQRAVIDAALAETDPKVAVRKLQEVLDPLCLVGVDINPESRVKAQAGAAPKELLEQGWRTFLVKVHNQAGVTAPLRATSPNAAPLHDTKSSSPEPPQTISSQDVVQRWLDINMVTQQPLIEPLSGLPVEYRVMELYSRDRGQREAKLSFDVGQGSQDLGFRSEVNLLFDCEPSVPVKLKIQDTDGKPTTGKFTIRDARGRVYPARSRRLSPDLAFQDQVYRHDGETVLLPAGSYHVAYTRGPEYRVLERDIEVPAGKEHTESFELQRWINMTEAGWFSGDHHVHAAGCSHYSSPTQGSKPIDMFRHIKGEDLNVGCMLTWGPCWYYQKQFFQGQVDPLSTALNVMRYDVEVSGFPSSHAGHLVLLRLKEDDYPGTTRIEQWPSWDLPILKWGQEQGGVVGFAHSGWGLQTKVKSLPDYGVPKFDGIGANEFIVDVTHGACDFISTVDTPITWEMNIWYHTLNCGYTTRISGETDFPCIYGERVGLGRAYVKLPPGVPVDFDHWVDGIRDGRSYCCDGLTHLFDFAVNDLGVGEAGAEGRKSVLRVAKGQPLKIKCKAAGLLEEKAPTDNIAARDLDQKPYWSIERARIASTRSVPVELIVNGYPVERKTLEADGRVEDIEFEYTPERSSWVALRVFPAAHTNPVFVEVDGQPIRASKRSADWCLKSVEQCWAQKSPSIRAEELEAAKQAYAHATQAYQAILAESYDDTASDKQKPADNSKR